MKPLILAALSAVALAACNKAATPAASPEAQAAGVGLDPATVVATYGEGKKITLGELDSKNRQGPLRAAPQAAREHDHREPPQPGGDEGWQDRGAVHQGPRGQARPAHLGRRGQPESTRRTRRGSAAARSRSSSR
ncbi:MAG: hypothetical protein QM765_50470 [Myxococcales bacterium]